MTTTTIEKQEEIRQAAENLYAAFPDWVRFYREILGIRGVIRRNYPIAEERTAFEQTQTYQEIQCMLSDLRKRSTDPPDEKTKVVTLRIPKSLHDAIRDEAHERRTSVNKLCISKLLQFIDSDLVPPDIVEIAEEEEEEGEAKGEGRAAAAKRRTRSGERRE